MKSILLILTGLLTPTIANAGSVLASGSPLFVAMVAANAVSARRSLRHAVSRQAVF